MLETAVMRVLLVAILRVLREVEVADWVSVPRPPLWVVLPPVLLTRLSGDGGTGVLIVDTDANPLTEDLITGFSSVVSKMSSSIGIGCFQN